jgi:O-antigen ligase
LVLALAPLPFASNRAWAWTLLALLVGILCVTWPVALRGENDLPRMPVARFAVPGVLFGAALLWGLVQTLTFAPVELQHPLWAQTARALGRVVEGGIALDLLAAESRLLRLLSYAGIFWIAAQHAASGRRARVLIDVCAVIGAVYAAYGLVVFLSGSETILGYDKWAYHGYLTSTFVNRNHFATFAGLSALCAAAALARRLEDGARIWSALLRRDALLYVAALVLCLAALFATASRAGIAATAAGFAVWYLFRVDTTPTRRYAALAAIVAVVAAALYFVFGWRSEGTLDENFETRMRVYRAAIALIEARPWLGYGLGSFGAAFATLRTHEITQIWTEAHNVYLELALEFGMPAVLAFLGAQIWIIAVCARKHASRIAVVALGAAATIALHSAIDFSVQIPAVAALWAALLGAGYGRACVRA